MDLAAHFPLPYLTVYSRCSMRWLVWKPQAIDIHLNGEVVSDIWTSEHVCYMTGR